jgi:hypothetical protein
MLIKTKFWFPEVFFGMLLAVLLFVLGAIFSFAQHPSNDRNPNNTTQYSANNTTDNDATNERIAEYTRGLYIVTAILAGATVLLVIATVGLGIITGRGIRNQSEQTRVIERAFISVEPGGISAFSGDDERIACNIIINNAGNLPASHVSWFIDKIFSKNGNEPEQSFPIGKLEGDIVLAPKTKAKKGSKPTDQNSFDACKVNSEPDKAWLFVFGKIAYHDGFSDGRWITFCHRYNLRGATGYTIPEDTGRYHENGNRTDES